MKSAICLNKLSDNANAVATVLDTALQYFANAQLRSNLADVEVLTFLEKR